MPTDIAQIDAAWLTQALRERFPGVTVREAHLVDAIRGTCTKLRYRLVMDDAGRAAGIPDYVMLKTGLEPHSPDMYFMMVIEARAYGEVLGPLGLRSPRCYYAGYDASQGVVIMDDLRARGAQMCSPLVPQTEPQIRRRLSALAKFHAQTWNTSDFAAGGRWDWVKECLPRDIGFMGRYLEPEDWNRRIVSGQAAAASVQFHDLNWMTDAVHRLAALAARNAPVLIHGDTHLGNLYIDVDGEPGFFDPQPHRGAAMQEIAYHIGGTLDPVDRRRWERDLIRHYLDELSRHGVDAFSLDEAMAQYAAFLAFGYMIFLINDAVFQPVSINTAYVARFNIAMIDNNTSSVLKMINI